MRSLLALNLVLVFAVVSFSSQSRADDKWMGGCIPNKFVSEPSAFALRADFYPPLYKNNAPKTLFSIEGSFNGLDVSIVDATRISSPKTVISIPEYNSFRIEGEFLIAEVYREDNLKAFDLQISTITGAAKLTIHRYSEGHPTTPTVLETGTKPVQIVEQVRRKRHAALL